MSAVVNETQDFAQDIVDHMTESSQLVLRYFPKRPSAAARGGRKTPEVKQSHKKNNRISFLSFIESGSTNRTGASCIL